MFFLLAALSDQTLILRPSYSFLRVPLTASSFLRSSLRCSSAGAHLGTLFYHRKVLPTSFLRSLAHWIHDRPRFYAFLMFATVALVAATSSVPLPKTIVALSRFWDRTLSLCPRVFPFSFGRPDFIVRVRAPPSLLADPLLPLPLPSYGAPSYPRISAFLPRARASRRNPHDIPSAPAHDVIPPLPFRFQFKCSGPRTAQIRTRVRTYLLVGDKAASGEGVGDATVGCLEILICWVERSAEAEAEAEAVGTLNARWVRSVPVSQTALRYNLVLVPRMDIVSQLCGSGSSNNHSFTGVWIDVGVRGVLSMSTWISMHSGRSGMVFGGRTLGNVTVGLTDVIT
ncbi:hypothetical protein B0H10DRAFT_1941002 [Mycena sp. CBHHK59/15]|nr:hypothetical protein B0H10DRAFT_1941002 [Mycena sp. CBHHK59/15]